MVGAMSELPACTVTPRRRRRGAAARDVKGEGPGADWRGTTDAGADVVGGGGGIRRRHGGGAAALERADPPVAARAVQPRAMPAPRGARLPARAAQPQHRAPVTRLRDLGASPA